ncbi:dihydrofolate reductase family protein [Chitinophaga alhagiae]|uniref:dihydrofolate reductase family protein n=1 Tax=Chitinophaga alhagiae TaxID=2203219 RepID=UPI000E5AD648|nr:dihydrofolate reductase family protein [Chitinophaga alhagiae]
MSRKIILSVHVSLDGFVGGPKGEMDWIKIDDEMFNFVGTFTDAADGVIYGRKTYEMMQAYWPTADQQPNATKHDLQHSEWYRRVDKLVISRTMQNEQREKTQFAGDHIPEKVRAFKQQPGKNILIFGSPSAAHLLMEHGLIDEYWLFYYPVAIGGGIPLFRQDGTRQQLQLLECKKFPTGMVGMHYHAPTPAGALSL